jgi:hypothetical protein
MRNDILRGKIIEKFGSQIKFAEVIGWRQTRLSMVIQGWLPPKEDRQFLADKLGVETKEIFPQC